MKALFTLSLFSLLSFSTTFAQAAGGATCYGGPGMYPYPCPKPAQPKICYGGPGMYPYPCPVER